MNWKGEPNLTYAIFNSSARAGDRFTLDAFKRRASEMLRTERGSQLRKQRSVDVETIFGDIKRNWRFDRFSLRGLEKVDHEFRLIAAGHNLRKLTLALAV